MDVCFKWLPDWFGYSDYVENAIGVCFFFFSIISSSGTVTSVCDPCFVYLGVYWAHQHQLLLLQNTG